MIVWFVNCISIKAFEKNIARSDKAEKPKIQAVCIGYEVGTHQRGTSEWLHSSSALSLRRARHMLLCSICYYIYLSYTHISWALLEFMMHLMGEKIENHEKLHFDVWWKQSFCGDPMFYLPVPHQHSLHLLDFLNAMCISSVLVKETGQNRTWNVLSVWRRCE